MTCEKKWQENHKTHQTQRVIDMSSDSLAVQTQIGSTALNRLCSSGTGKLPSLLNPGQAAVSCNRSTGVPRIGG